MYLLKSEHIRKSYRNNHVLKDINFGIKPGMLAGVVGENGSGKSTLLKILAGELEADSGDVMVNGEVGYCPQQPVLNESLTVAEHLDYFGEVYRMRDSSYVTHLVNELGYLKFMKVEVAELSGGTRQKLNLTLAIMNKPAVLLLDEPYQGFDWETYLRFWTIVEELKGSGKAIVVISHLIFEQKKFDHIFHLEEGKIREVSA